MIGTACLLRVDIERLCMGTRVRQEWRDVVAFLWKIASE
jgi:hypothetical protein